VIALLAAASFFAAVSDAKDKKVKHEDAAPKDDIEIVAQVPVTNGPVTRFVVTQHYSSVYLYAEHEGGKLTLIDVTNASAPLVLAQVASVAGTNGALTAVAGTAALVGNEPLNPPTAQNPQTMRIMDFSDPQNPKSVHEFTNIVATTRDAGRGLIFLADRQSIWILRQHFAQDPQQQKAYEDYVLYGSR
jgi:hypothetical protein